jgi:hypothetical protein
MCALFYWRAQLEAAAAALSRSAHRPVTVRLAEESEGGGAARRWLLASGMTAAAGAAPLASVLRRHVLLPLAEALVPVLEAEAVLGGGEEGVLEQETGSASAIQLRSPLVVRRIQGNSGVANVEGLATPCSGAVLGNDMGRHGPLCFEVRLCAAN